MSAPDLSLALVGVIEGCCKSGIQLLKACKDLKNADARLDEFRLRIEQTWSRTNSQLLFVQGAVKVMDEHYRASHEEALLLLKTKLELAEVKIAAVSKRPSGAGSSSQTTTKDEARKVRFITLQNNLEEVVSDLERWQFRFDPTWFLLMKIADPLMDMLLKHPPAPAIPTIQKKQTSPWIQTARQVRRGIYPENGESKDGVLLRPGVLIPESITRIPLSVASTALREDDSSLTILDPISFLSRDAMKNARNDCYNFAKKLRHANPYELGLLDCKGPIKNDGIQSPTPAGGAGMRRNAKDKLSLVFLLPKECTSVQSLRWLLLNRSEDEERSLSDRFALAEQVVRAVSSVHLYGFVHKNIRPESILVLGSGESMVRGGSRTSEIPVLVGFNILRNADGKTFKISDEDWEKCLYRHPSRQAQAPQVRYEMRHDIYSIGVCLLEIGLWESFIAYSEPMVDEGQDAASAETAEIGPGILQTLEDKEIAGPDLMLQPVNVKEKLLNLARGKLRRKMGTRYSKVVETCLTCLDRDNEDFGDDAEFEDELGVVVDTRYIEKVVAKLNEISI